MGFKMYKRHLLTYCLALMVLGIVGVDTQPGKIGISLDESEGADGYIVVLKQKKDTALDVTSENQERIVSLLEKEHAILTKKRYNTLNALWVMGTVSQMEEAKIALADVIEYIEANRKVEMTAVNNTCYEQRTAGSLWGLTRIAMRKRSSYEGQYFPHSQLDNGTGVTAYVVDSGINIDHEDFGDRAQWGYTVPDTAEGDYDGNGHGSHVAGTIGGLTYGAAKGVTLVAVKVFTSAGSGLSSWTIEGIEWVINDFKGKGSGKAVINLSLGGLPSTATEQAIRTAVDEGIVVIAAAGNDAIDACHYSPARMSEVITVASSGRADLFSSFSNHGRCVDIIAPGEDIKSASHEDNTSTATKQGTSMAAPHVAGVVARYLSTACDPPTPTAVRNWLLGEATTSEISQVPSRTANKMLFTECLSSDACAGSDDGNGDNDKRDCATVTVQGSSYHASRHGDYTIRSSLCGGRPSYKHRNEDDYVYFYLPAYSWIVGPTNCGSSGYLLAVAPYAMTPDQVDSGEWKEATWIGPWRTNVNIGVTCGASQPKNMTWLMVIAAFVLCCERALSE